MPASLSAFLAALLLLYPLAASAAEPTQITVTGTGTVTLPPDEAIVNAAVQTNSDTATEATSENSATYQRVVAALVGIGLDRADITLAGFNMSYRQRPATGATSYLQYGYTVVRTFTATTHNLPLAGRIVDAATAAGATDVNDVTYDLSERGAANKQALHLAMQDAASKATDLAADAHLRIVGIASVTMNGAYGPGVPLGVVAHMSVGVPTNFDNSNVSVTQTVTVIYLAKP